MNRFPDTGPYSRTVEEINWENSTAKFADDDSTILMVAEDVLGNPVGTYAIKNPDTDIPQFLDMVEGFLAERFDLAGSIQLIVEG